MIDPRIHIGEQYGVFVIEDVLPEKDKYGHWIYKAVCQECGFVRYSHYGRVKNKIVTVCNHIDQNNEYKRYNTNWTNRRIGNIFIGMKRRCYSPNNKDYGRYGARGIKICDEWLNNPKSFEEWALCNGYSDNLTIDRNSEDDNYCPENCVWIPNNINSKYKSTTNLIEVDGEVHTGKDWGRILNLGENIVNRYVRRYGKENTIEFIHRYLSMPKIERKNEQSYYELYMNDNFDIV